MIQNTKVFTFIIPIKESFAINLMIETAYRNTYITIIIIIPGFVRTAPKV